MLTCIRYRGRSNDSIYYLYIGYKQPKIGILYSRYSRKNKKTTESVIFRLYSKGIVERRSITDSVVFLLYLEYREYKMSIFGICFILYRVYTGRFPLGGSLRAERHFPCDWNCFQVLLNNFGGK